MKALTTYCMALMIAGIACNKTESSNLTAQQLNNVAYGPHEQEVMDVYLPADRTSTNTKALMLIHGGAWVSGDKAEMNTAVAALQKLLPDYAIFNINYRLANTNGNLWPAQLEDVNMAFDFIIDHADEYRFNPELVAIGGASAGGHLALLQAYKSNGKFKAVADLFGPTDMKVLYNNSLSNTKFVMEIFMGGTPVSNPTAFQSASPIDAVSSKSPPTIILHGTADNIVPIYHSDTLNSKLSSAAVPGQYEIYPGEGHGIWNTANTADAYLKIAAFFKTHVK